MSSVFVTSVSSGIGHALAKAWDYSRALGRSATCIAHDTAQEHLALRMATILPTGHLRRPIGGKKAYEPSVAAESLLGRTAARSLGTCRACCGCYR